jgi:hypothetical protein
MPMPPELRAYATEDELYPVMGLVQYCNKVTVDGRTTYHTGVGFIGKNVPESYKKNPSQSYRISGMSDEGLWQITEADSPFKPRKNPRYWVALPVVITLLQKSGQTVRKERTHTIEIAATGVSVVCSLEASIDERLKFACEEYNFYSLATVRNRKESDGKPTTLHLEFVDEQFPVADLPELKAVDQGDTAPKTTNAPGPPETGKAGGENFEFSRF